MISEFQREIMYKGQATRGRLVADAEECAKIDEQLKTDPENYYLWAARGIVCATAEEAVDSYSMALSIRPLAPNMLYNRGRRFMSLGRYRQSLADLRLATTLDPEDGWKWHFYGVALYFLGRYQDAADAFEHAIEANDRSGVPLLPFDIDWMWNAYGKLGERDKMAQCIKRVGPDTPVLDTEETYRRRLLVYNGYMSPQEFLDTIDYSDHVETANQLYGLGNYYYYICNDLELGVKYLKEALTYTEGKMSWGYKMAKMDLPEREKELAESQARKQAT